MDDGTVTLPFICQGRTVNEFDALWLRDWIIEHPEWSRRRLAAELCRAWEWLDAAGRLKDFAARSFLLKMEKRGLIHLPALRFKGSTSPATRPVVEREDRSEPILSSLAHLQPVDLQPVIAGSDAAHRAKFYLHRFHYLGWRVVGENMLYLAADNQGRDLAVLLFGASAWRCAPRDQYLGWDAKEHRQNLNTVVNNTRFLILPQVKVPHLASHLLGRCARRICADWQLKYGHTIHWLETFVDTERFTGTCYQAANWHRVGLTTGRSRQDRNHTLQVPRKAVFLYKLARP